MSAILDALLNELVEGDESALARLADKLAPLLVDRLVPPPSGEGWLRGADEIAAYIGSPAQPGLRARVREADSGPARRLRAGRPRSELDSWLQNGGGKRP